MPNKKVVLDKKKIRKIMKNGRNNVRLREREIQEWVKKGKDWDEATQTTVGMSSS